MQPVAPGAAVPPVSSQKKEHPAFQGRLVAGAASVSQHQTETHEPSPPSVTDRQRQTSRTPVARLSEAERVVPAPPAYQGILTFEPDAYLPEVLRNDQAIEDCCQHFLQRREAMDRLGKEYTFPPLLVTLKNAQCFIRYLQENDHFHTPLTPAEHRALIRMQHMVDRTLEAQTPYERTLFLTLLLVTVYDVLVQKHVLGPVCQAAPHLTHLTHWPFPHAPDIFLFPFREEPGRGVRNVAAIDLEALVSCRWGGLNPEGEDEARILTSRSFWCLRNELITNMHDRGLLLWPVWKTFDPDDLCRFDGLPICPLALSADYCPPHIGNALITPLTKMGHALSDAHRIPLMGSTPESPLGNWKKRRCLRQLVLDSLPAALQPLHLEKALSILMHELLFSNCSQRACRYLESPSFVGLLSILTIARIQSWRFYPVSHREITGVCSATAALWAHKVFQHWQQSASGHLPDWLSWVRADRSESLELERLGHDFVRNDLPLLKKHLHFLEQHWADLRQLFLSRAEVHPAREHLGQPRIFATPDTPHLSSSMLPFFFKPGDCPDHSDSVDYTNLVYFSELHVPERKGWMEEATGSSIPSEWGTP